MKLTTFLLLCFLYASAHAGETLRHGEAPEPAPAKQDNTIKPEDLEPGPEDAPQVTITKKTDQTIEEYRMGGKLYMIKVTPKYGKPYYLVDDRGDGKFARQEGLDTGLRVPRWVIKKF